MKMLNKIVIIIVLVLALTACQTQLPKYVPVQTKTTVRERLVPVQLPADSSYIRLWLECDERNNVMLKQMSNTAATGSMENEIKLLNNKLEILTKRQSAEAQIAVQDSIVEREVPVPVEVPIEVNRLWWWQKMLMWGGVLFIAVISVAVLSKLKINK